MKPSLKLVALPLLLAAGVLALATGARPRALSTGAQAAQGAQAAEAQPARAAALPARRWQQGDAFVYELRASRAVGAGEKRLFSASLQAIFTVTVLGQEGAAVQLRGQLSSPRFEAGGSLDGAAVEALTRPFYFSARPGGEFYDFAFSKNAAPEEIGLLRGLAQSFQLVAPPPGLASWQTLEQDMTGEFKATYTRLSGGVHKSKDAYTRARGAAGLAALPGEYAVRSSINMDVDDSGWPRTLSDEETLDMKINQSSLRSASKTSATLLRVDRAADLAVDRGALVAEASTDAEAFERASRSADQSLIAGRDYRAIAAELRAPESTRRNDAMVAMSALFRADAAAVDEARDAVLGGSLDDERVARTTAALGHAATPEAQRALAAIAASPDADSTRAAHALGALGLSSNQIPENEAAIKKAMTSEARDVASAATLALGNSIRARNGDKPGDTSGALRSLVDGLAGAPSAEEQRLFLLALGNSGDPRALDAIEPFLKNSDIDLRIAATSALRFIPGERADKGILEATHDPEYLVRKTAVETVPFRPASPLLPALAQLLQTDPQETVRVAIVVALHAKSKEDPSTLDALRWAEQHDPSKKVRNTAGKYLSQGV